MAFKIGVFGSAAGELDKFFSKAEELGEELAKHNVILITGASDGLPYKVVETASKLGAKVWGYSTATDIDIQKIHHPQVDPKIFEKLFFIPKDYDFASQKQVCMKYRNVTSTANCDAGIIISGRWGTLNEFTNLFDLGKVIGVLTDTGGVADELESLSKKISKPSKAKIIFNSHPSKLVKQVINELEIRK